MKTVKQISFEDMVGKVFPFYGVVGTTFKIGKHVFHCVEYEEDGYRSSMKEVVHVDSKGLEFETKSLGKVHVVSVDRKTHARRPDEPTHNIDSGYHLVDVKTGNVVLAMGTDNEDDYYPYFVFDYQPIGTKQKKCPHCSKNLE